LKNAQALILGTAIVVASVVGGGLFYAARAPEGSITVVGAATKRFESDMVKWRITLSRPTGLRDVSAGFRALRGDLERFRQMLAAREIDPETISVQPVNTLSNWGGGGQVVGYNLQQTAFVLSDEIDVIEGLALDPSSLTDSGVILQSSTLEYFSSRLDDIKVDLLAEATLDARRRAEEIVSNTGAGLGSPIAIRSGVFQIREPYSTEVTDYGMYNTQSREKDITVTVRVTFRLN
jgi:hypothetical protein